MTTALKTLVLTLTLVVATDAQGQHSTHRHYANKQHHHPGGQILPPGPGYGYGFPNHAADGYGWYDVGTAVPLGADRTPEYYFPRHLSIPIAQMVFPTYYNDYVTRSQRYIPYTGCGGFLHPAGGPQPPPTQLPVHPYDDLVNSPPVVPPPVFSGEVQARPINRGSTNLNP